MLQVEWSETRGWHQPRIVPYQDIRLDPTAGVFHYGFECFEGMKVYRDAGGHLRFFRPAMNLDRFSKSALRIALPSLDGVELLKLIAEFVKVDERFVLAYNLAMPRASSLLTLTQAAWILLVSSSRPGRYQPWPWSDSTDFCPPLCDCFSCRCLLHDWFQADLARGDQ